MCHYTGDIINSILLPAALSLSLSLSLELPLDIDSGGDMIAAAT